MLLPAHCCKASLRISWDRRCANSKTTVSGPDGFFTSCSTLTGEGILGRNLSPDIKLSSLACCFSLSHVVGNGKVCFDFMQPMLWRALKESSSKDYFNSIFGKHWACPCDIPTSAFPLQATAVISASFYQSSPVVFICQKKSFILKLPHAKYCVIR